MPSQIINCFSLKHKNRKDPDISLMNFPIGGWMFQKVDVRSITWWAQGLNYLVNHWVNPPRARQPYAQDNRPISSRQTLSLPAAGIFHFSNSSLLTQSPTTNALLGFVSAKWHDHLGTLRTRKEINKLQLSQSYEQRKHSQIATFKIHIIAVHWAAILLSAK